MDNLDQLLKALLAERTDLHDMRLPEALEDKRELLRILMNTRDPAPISAEILAMQDRELAAQATEKGVIEPEDIPVSPLYPRLRLWQGDITRLHVDAIVNAANNKLLGCFMPLHKCIDNAIHSAAGLQLRGECAKIMRVQGHDEETGKAKITDGYNLPAKYVIHTVGPIVQGKRPSKEDCRLLADCYESCLDLAQEHEVESMAFCCISTGVFGFPQDEAARIAVDTVRGYFAVHPASCINCVVFDVFSDRDYAFYRSLLGYK